jgi:hypothetical protein
MKRGNYEPGDILEIVGRGKFAYCRALHRDSFGMMFEILAGIYESSVGLNKLKEARKAVCYINEASTKRRWRLVGSSESQITDIPAVFNGHPDCFWSVYEDGKEETVSAKTTEAELVAQGFIPRVLWLASSIEAFVFNGKPLTWNWT